MSSSSVYPLFKPGASSLGGACLAAHVTIQPCSSFAEVIAVTPGRRICYKWLFMDCHSYSASDELSFDCITYVQNDKRETQQHCEKFSGIADASWHKIKWHKPRLWWLLKQEWLEVGFCINNYRNAFDPKSYCCWQCVLLLAGEHIHAFRDSTVVIPWVHTFGKEWRMLCCTLAVNI